jgi:hypothetical protein
VSENCGNPSCPIHGSTPEANALRQAKQEIVTNEELMDVIRLLAANATQEIISTAGFPTSADDLLRMRMILGGSYDRDMIVQGIIKGLAVLMTGGHEPTKVFVTKNSEVKETPFVIERLTQAREQRDGIRRTPSPYAAQEFASLDELFSFIFGRR